MFDYDENAKQSVEILDKYDLNHILKNCYGVSIYDVRDQLTHIDKKVNDAVYNLSIDELAEYLHKRYSMRIEEIIIPYVWYNDRYYMNKQSKE